MGERLARLPATEGFLPNASNLDEDEYPPWSRSQTSQFRKPDRFPVSSSDFCSGGTATGQSVTGSDATESLKSVAADRFRIGVGISERVLADPKCAALVRQHFQILTPENCMKPQGIHPGENEWHFDAPDRFVAFAKKNHLEVVGHCLVWAKDDRTDDWMKQGDDGQPVSRDELLRRIETHVATVVSRYHDTATMWDVVNEALADGDRDYLRDSVYSRTTGIDFIETAFRTARKHDPDALLIYNDYNCHFSNKRKKLIRLLTELKERGVPVDAYGMQGHFELGDDSLTQLRETFAALRQLDIKVVISELDIDVVTRGRWWAEDGKYREELKTYDPYREGIPPDVERRQMDQYVALFRLFHEYQDVIARVSFWNLHDGQSWLNYFPWRRTNYPLLFDRELKPKPVYHAVLAALRATKPKHAAQERPDPLSQGLHRAQRRPSGVSRSHNLCSSYSPGTRAITPCATQKSPAARPPHRAQWENPSDQPAHAQCAVQKLHAVPVSRPVQSKNFRPP